MEGRFPRVRPGNVISADEFRWIGAIVAAELLLLAAYFGITSAEATGVRYALYPFVWINVGLWAAWKVTPPIADRRARWVAAAVAGAYFLVLCIVAGLVSIGGSPVPQAGGTRLVMASPGWGPAVVYAGSTFQVAAVPYLVIGYLSLAYLVYVTLLEAANAAMSGVLGLVSCVGCTFPVIASLVAGVAGGSSALTAAVYALSIDLSTVVFVLAVALLYWRPGFGVRHPDSRT
jgi:hypothetical protein